MSITQQHTKIPSLERIRNAYEKVCRILLDRRTPEGYWTGRLSASALSTATAVSALAILSQGVGNEDYHKPIQRGVDWLLAHQNSDGGWGDTDKSFSNVSTTLLVQSALALVRTYQKSVWIPDSLGKFICPHPNPLPEGEGTMMNPLSEGEGTNCNPLSEIGGFTPAALVDAIKQRYGKDQTFSVPILTNAALAGLVDWKDVPQLPFEWAALPMAWFRFVKMNVVSYAIPALVAIGQVKFHFSSEKWNPLRWIRRLVKNRTLRLIQEMQPESGGYLEAAPLTSFVLMSLAAMGLHDHPIVTKGVRFLLDTVRDDGSWSIDTNLAAWLTSLSISALETPESQTIDWLLSCQHKQRHPFTGASPGGWGWTNLSGAVPDADDTSAALLALTPSGSVNAPDNIVAGIHWLLELQNKDGGMPTFCRGWGMLPFDKSSTDITAHVIRAFQAIRTGTPLRMQRTLMNRMQRAEERMFAFLKRSQKSDGSWLPLWFGNQSMPEDTNPFYGTARVLLALAETKRESAMAQSGLRYLIGNQNSDGSWGNSVEETAVVVEAFAIFAHDRNIAPTYYHGLHWLLEAVESDRFLQPSPIGLYFAKLWYYEDLYPIIFTASALRRALS